MLRDKLAEQRDCLVTDAALDHGLTHLGRLAQAYRRLFGESPVQTRRKHGVDGEDDAPAPLPAGR
jgi:AraC-like DNA-binding protein